MWIAISELLAGGGDIGPCVYLLRTLKVLFHCWTGTRGEGGCWGWFLLHRDVSLTHQEIALDLLPMEDNRVACNLLFLRLLIMGKFLLLTLFFRSHIWYVSVHGWLSDLSALRSTEYICTTSNAKAKFTPRRGGGSPSILFPPASSSTCTHPAHTRTLAQGRASIMGSVLETTSISIEPPW